MGVNIKATSGPVVERAGRSRRSADESRGGRDRILFIHEIHRLNHVVEEVLYPAMEDYQIDILIGQGPAARSMKLPLKPFTLIGATTRSGLLTSPLRDRFGQIFRLDFYSTEALAQILKRSASILGVAAEDDGTAEIARRSRHAADRESAPSPGARFRPGQGGWQNYETGYPRSSPDVGS